MGDKINKKQRYECIYRTGWEQHFKWLKPVANDNTKANCVLCKKEFAVNNRGIHQVKQHGESEGHKIKAKSHTNNHLIDVFCKNVGSNSEDRKVAAQEVSLVYHNVKHNLSYNSLDCNVKLLKHILPDVTKRLTLGRTKAEALVLNVLGPKAVENVVAQLNDGVFFAIQIDASNVKNRKFFPVTVQYFIPHKGIINRIINFFENPDESATGMFISVEQTLKELQLSFESVSCFSADNCNANFGANHSLYTELKQKNKSLLKANCNAHIVHNTVRHIVEKLDYDVENLVLKVYAHFSLSAKRREILKEFSEFTEVEYFELTRYVTTRWLSLNPCIEKMLRLWKTLLSYFRSNRECPKQIQKLLYIKENEYDDIPENSIPEIYLLFLNSFLKIFEDAILSLESNSVSIIDVYHIFYKLVNKIEQRLEQQFFGFLVMQKLRDLDSHKSDEIKRDFLNAYQVGKAYLLKWFNFSENGLPFIMSKLKLNHEISFAEMSACIQVISNINFSNLISMDALFDELAILHKIFRLCEKDNSFLSSSESEKWVHILSKTTELPNITKTISFILSIPCTTAYVERIFSIMSNKWTETRNRASAELIKCELSITLNFDMLCSDFFDYVLHDSALLAKCQSHLKYNKNK